MGDQAEKLRILMKKVSSNQLFQDEIKTRVISITSGKGGVGKTNFVANLGYALSDLNKKVFLFDADMGLANLDIVLGVSPRQNLMDFIEGKALLKEVVLKLEPNIYLLPGGSGFQELTNLTYEEKKRVLTEISKFTEGFDFILIDTGAGISEDVLSFALAADEVIVITTPEPTAILDAYSTIKVLFQRDPTVNLKLVVNMAETRKSGENTARTLKTIVKKFLKKDLSFLGTVPSDHFLKNAVSKQIPLIKLHPHASSARAIVDIAKKLCGEKKERKRNFYSLFFSVMTINDSRGD